MTERETTEEPLKFLEPPEIRGVSKDLIADLQDIVYKFGTVTADDQMVRFINDDPNLLISASIKPENRGNLIVAVSTTPQEGISILKTNKGIILWDKSLTAKDAKEAVAKIDAAALEAGLINRSNGERIPLPPEASFASQGEFLYRVDEVFDNPDAGMPIFDEDPESLLKRFDKPVELTVITRWMQGRKVQSIVRKKDIEYHEKREIIAREILAEQSIDINNPEVLENLSIEKIMEIRQETERRMKGNGQDA